VYPCDQPPQASKPLHPTLSKISKVNLSLSSLNLAPPLQQTLVTGVPQYPSHNPPNHHTNPGYSDPFL